MARSSVGAPASPVSPSDTRNLHRPEPHLRLPTPPHRCPHWLHPRGANGILGGMSKVVQKVVNNSNLCLYQICKLKQ